MIESTLDQWLRAIGLTLSADALTILIMAACALLGYVLGQRITRLRERRQQALVLAQVEQEREEREEQLASLSDTFAALSQTALHANNQSFLDLAKETLGRFQERATHELGAKEKNIANLVRPIRDTLEKTDQQLRQMEQQRAAAQGRLSAQIEQMSVAHNELQRETRNLVQALRRPEVRGQWGELTLKRLVELAGMSEYCDFEEQVHTSTEEGSIRPDMVVNMPGGRQVVVDVKAPLDAYLSATEAPNEDEKNTFLAKHASNIKARIKELASKRYWEQFEQAPDFAILFIPGEQFLSSALHIERDLIEQAMQQRVILATPTSLVGLLRAIAYGWSQESLNKNAEIIRDIGQELHSRLSKLSEHMTKLGKSLDVSVQQFNRLVGSYESKVLPGARRFTELGIGPGDEIDAPDGVGTPARQIVKSE